MQRSFTVVRGAAAVAACCSSYSIGGGLVRRSGGALPVSSALSSATPAASGIALATNVRRYVNALYRLPPQHTIPTHAPDGTEIDTELFLRQIKSFFEILKMSQLVEHVHEMKSCPHYECLFTNEIMFQHYDLILPMPKFGREQRATEMSETIRYMRGCGASGDINHVLQDVKGGRAHGGDFISTTHGFIMGYGGLSRTNKLCANAMTGAGYEDPAAGQQMQQLNCRAIELLPQSPPLSEMVGFSGTRTFLASDTECGRDAVEKATQCFPQVPWQVLRIEPGCSFLTHICGAKYVYDVLCDQDFPVSLERIGESGLNPFPVEWSEPRKLGISMRAVCLIARYARGTMNAGGYADSVGHKASNFNYHSKSASKNARLFTGGHRQHGDQQAPYLAQLSAGELGDPVYQRKPRYAPPMHRKGQMVPRNDAGN